MERLPSLGPGHPQHSRPARLAMRRRTVLAALLVAPLPALAQTPSEAAVREASAAYVKAWNRHDIKAWADFLAPDVWYTEADDFYERFKGRDKVVGWFEFNVKNADLAWEVQRLKALPDGSVGVVLKQTMSMLPRKNGKYASVFVSEPSFARWRPVDGRWQIVFFTSHAGWARDQIKKAGME